MKTLLLLTLLSLNSHAKTDWKTAYEGIEDKASRLKFEDYIEACQDGVDKACGDGWHTLIQAVREKPEYTTSGPPETHNALYINRLHEVCPSTNTRFCIAGLELLNNDYQSSKGVLQSKQDAQKEQDKLVTSLGDKVSDDDKKLQSDLTTEASTLGTVVSEAKDVLMKYSHPICEIDLRDNLDSKFCNDYTLANKEQFANKMAELEAACLKADVSACTMGHRLAVRLESSGPYVVNICGKNASVDSLPFCAEYLDQQRRAQEEIAASKATTRNWIIGISVFIVGFIALFIKSTQCYSCKKYFALVKTNIEHHGTSHSQVVENIKTGEIRNRDGDVRATIHQDVTFNVKKDHYVDTYTCKYCGANKRSSRTESKKSRS